MEIIPSHDELLVQGDYKRPKQEKEPQGKKV